jgi:hypothetical protein
LGACELLRYFASHGNLAAAKRLVDVHQMCENVGIPLDRGAGEHSGTSSANTTILDDNVVDAAAAEGSDHGLEPISDSGPQELDSDIMRQVSERSLFPQQLLPDELNLEDFSSNEYVVENDTGMEMTGVIDTDWDMLLQASLCGNLWEQLCQTT